MMIQFRVRRRVTNLEWRDRRRMSKPIAVADRALLAIGRGAVAWFARRDAIASEEIGSLLDGSASSAAPISQSLFLFAFHWL